MTAPGVGRLARAVDKRTISVLLIEDNELDAMLVQSALETATQTQLRAEHYDYAWAKTMREARDLLASRSFDLLIVDLALPDSAGLETVQRVRDAAQGAAMLVITARDDYATAKGALALGAQDYLVKGEFSFPALERALRYALDRKELAEQHVRDQLERERLEEQLRNSQRMEALGRLAGGVAHDFNNVLTIILGHAGMLRDRTATGDDADESVREILRAGERAARLTGQLLAFSRSQPASPKVLRLNDAIRDLERMLSRLLGGHIELGMHLEPRLPNVRIDPGHVEQLLINLAVNARDAMPEGGVLTISTELIVATDAIRRHRPYVTPGPYVYLAIADTGAGMDETVSARAFEPFFTTKKLGEGTGLGLSTVYGIVKQAQGYIWCRSSPGRGTRFDIYLPATAEPVDAGPPGGDRRTVLRQRILVVDDNASVREVVLRTLRAAGHSVEEAGSGPEAMRVAETTDQPFDVLLTDLLMPGIHGRELARRLNVLWPRLEVIYMSGYTDDQVIRRGELPANHVFLQKPFQRDELLSAISRATSAPEAGKQP